MATRKRYSGYTFTPASSHVDLTGVTPAITDFGQILAITNCTAKAKIFKTSTPGFGGSFAAGVLTFEAPTTGMASTDKLLIIFEDGLDAQPVSVSGSVSIANLPATQPVSAASLPLPAGAATDATLQSLLTTLQAQRAESLWTDDTNGFFVRVDKGGAITWTDPSGNASSAPGTGARPAAGTSAIVEASRYQATANGTGFSTTDYLSHIVTSDPSTGNVIGHFWLNVSTEAKLAAAPAAASVTPIASLPAGAATDASVQAVVARLPASLGQKQGAQSLPVVLSSDGPLAIAYGTSADAAVPDITAPGASFTFFSLYKGMTSSLLAIKNALLGTLTAAIASNAKRAVATGSLQNNNDAVTLAVDGMAAFGIQLSGAWTGSVSFVGSMDDGATYPIALSMAAFGTTGLDTTTATANGNWEKEAGALTHVRVVATTNPVGLVGVRIIATSGLKRVKVSGSAQNPLPVVGAITTTAVAAPRVTIGTAGIAVQGPNVALVNGCYVKAHAFNTPQSSTNTAAVGPSTVTNTHDVTGIGYPLAQGEVSAPQLVTNMNQLWYNGFAGDVFTIYGS